MEAGTERRGLVTALPMAHDAAAEQEKLPFDLRTLLIGVWQRRQAAAWCFGASFAAALLLGMLAGGRQYEADTVLLYTPTEWIEEDPDQAPSLNTQMNMVKVLSNLTVVRQRLQLDARESVIAAACDVLVQKETSLLIIRARWDDPVMAASIANALRDAFLEKQQALRREEARRRLAELDRDLDRVLARMRETDSSLQDFIATHGFMGTAEDAESYLDELAGLDAEYDRAFTEKRTAELQVDDLSRVISDLKKGRSAGESPTGDSRLLHMRIQQLRGIIEQDRTRRVNLSELAQKKSEAEGLRQLWEKGLVADIEYQRVRTAVERLRTLTEDTDQIAAWKRELESLMQAALASASSGPSALALQEMTLRQINLQLDLVAHTERTRHLEAARQRIAHRLDSESHLRTRYATLSRDLKAREAERDQIESQRARVHRIYSSDATDFGVVTAASVPPLPASSSRRLLFALVFFVGCLASVSVMVGQEFLDTTVKSGAELALRLELPVLGVIPLLHDPGIVLPDEADPLVGEALKSTARRVRAAAAGKGQRLLLVSARHGEGVTSVAASLACALGRLDERVLLTDGGVRRRDDREPAAAGPIRPASRPADQRSAAEVHEHMGRSLRDSACGRWLLLVLVSVLPASVALRMLRRAALLLPRLERDWQRVQHWLGGRWVQALDFGDRPSAFGTQHHQIRDLVTGDATSLQGLGEYLSYEVEDPKEVVWPSRLPGVECLPAVRPAVVPDLLGSARMYDLLQTLSRRFSLTLIDAPPVLRYADAEMLAGAADAILLVVQSGRCRAAALQKAVERLRRTGVPVIGAILNGVTSPYMEITQ